MQKKVKLSELVPYMKEAFAAGKTFTVPITGTSMLPLLVEGRDTVMLKSPVLPLKKGDLPLYRRKDGSFVLHRVVKVQNGSYTMCGDHQFLTERGILEDQIIALAAEINRDGKSISVDESAYKRYVRLWTALLHVRYPFRRLRYALHLQKGKCRGKKS